MNCDYLFNDNGDYLADVRYKRVYNFPIKETELMGKIMFFKSIDTSKNWKFLLENLIEDISNRNGLNFKFNEAVACMYIPANEYDKIKNVFKELKDNYPNTNFYYKMDHQTRTNQKFNDRNYIYNSSGLNYINDYTLKKAMTTFNMDLSILNEITEINEYLNDYDLDR